MRTTKHVEQFSSSDLLGLQGDLQQSKLDSWQAMEMLAAFLNGRGYGVNTELAQESVRRLESSHDDAACMQRELERVALVM